MFGSVVTIRGSAIKWLLAEPRIVTTLPNIYDDEQLAEFAAASDKPDLTAEQLARVAELDETNFGVDEAQMSYKGAMTRERGANLDLQTARNPTGRPALHAAAARES